MGSTTFKGAFHRWKLVMLACFKYRFPSHYQPLFYTQIRLWYFQFRPIKKTGMRKRQSA